MQVGAAGRHLPAVQRYHVLVGCGEHDRERSRRVYSEVARGEIAALNPPFDLRTAADIQRGSELARVVGKLGTSFELEKGHACSPESA
jgi:hypothetical protein